LNLVLWYDEFKGKSHDDYWVVCDLYAFVCPRYHAIIQAELESRCFRCSSSSLRLLSRCSSSSRSRSRIFCCRSSSSSSSRSRCFRSLTASSICFIIESIFLLALSATAMTLHFCNSKLKRDICAPVDCG